MPNIKDYLANGLTFMSDKSGVHPRDAAGNIILKDYDKNDVSTYIDNPTLLIEKNKFNYTVESVNRLIETRFQYFQFPVIVNTSTAVPELNFDDVDGAVNDPFAFDNDIISGRFRVVPNVDAYGQSVTYHRVNTSYASDWFKNGAGQDSGFKRLQFTTNEFAEAGYPGTYLITKDRIDYLKSKNKTIRFRIFIQFRSSRFDGKTNTGFVAKLNRREGNIGWTGGFYNGRRQPVLYTEDNGIFGTNEYPCLYMEYVLHPNDTWEDYRYEIEVVTGNPSWVLTDNCLWEVDMVDIPTLDPSDRPLWGNSDGPTNISPTKNYGVYDIGSKTELRNGNGKTIGRRNDNNSGFVMLGQLADDVNSVQSSIDQFQAYLQSKILQATVINTTKTAGLRAQVSILNVKLEFAKTKLKTALKTVSVNNPIAVAIQKSIDEHRTKIKTLQTEIDTIMNSDSGLKSALAQITILETQLQKLEDKFVTNLTQEDRLKLQQQYDATKKALLELKSKYK